jgi:hypothetical protein
MKYLVRDLQQDKAISTFYFFCKYRDRSTLQPTSIWRTVLAQIFQQDEEYVDYVYEQGIIRLKPPSKRTIEELISTFFATSDRHPLGFPQGVLAIDGLDECEIDDQRYVIDWLQRFVQSSQEPGRCKILITSRKSNQLELLLQSKPTISLDQEANLASDIGTYVDGRLSLAFADLVDSDKRHLQDVIVKRAGGTKSFQLQDQVH